MDKKVYISQAEIAKNKTLTVILFLLLSALIFGISVLIGYLAGEYQYGILIGVIVTVIVIPIQFLTSKFSILMMIRGKKCDPSDPRHMRVIRAVENMSISAGLRKVPDAYIIPSPVPNAFASGISEKDAFIGVTEGLLDLLDDNELTGVVAHEISHIVHRDILLSTLSVAMVTIIIILSGIATRIAFFGSRSRDDRNGNSGMIFALIALLSILLRPIASLISNIITMAISRKREYAADAYAVRLCSISEWLASALEKIAKYSPPYNRKVTESLGGSELKAMYIYFPKGMSLFSTHPPIEERIQILRNMY